jgi:hypothetical protein
MCTVTVLSRSRLTSHATPGQPVLLRLACNRDELESRATAIEPAVRAVGERRVVMPIDPESGGTWLAVNDAGLVFALLNRNPGGTAADGLTRGTIIPALAHAGSVSEALGALLDARAERHRPFRLLIVDRFRLAEAWLEEGRLRHRCAYLHGAFMRTSSSLDDALVEGPRRTLFRQFFRRPTAGVAAQDAFHDHQWTGREALSVRMRRAGARTVSQSVIEIAPGFAILTYRALDQMRQTRMLLPLAGSALAAGVRQCS